MKLLASNEFSIVNDSNLENCTGASGLIAIGFAVRGIVHMAHLSVSGTGSYAAHTALGSFYDGVIPLLDSYAESYQGRYGIIGTYPRVLSKYENPASGLASIITFRGWIDANRQTCGSESSLQNIIDEIVDLCNSTIYKLTNLQ